jgi:uncharacterized protein YjbJ (UPF0337 family)
MSTGTESKIKGKFDEIAGDIKQSFGESTDNSKIANEGAAQQVKGHAEQAWGSVTSAAKETADTRDHNQDHDSSAHDIRESITSTAQNVKNHIQNSVDDFRAKHDK